MSYSADNIIQVSASISPAGLSTANFASAMIIANELIEGQENNYKTYSTLADVAVDYATSSETYAAASMWLGGTPAIRSVMIWQPSATDASITDTLTAARNKVWWYWTILTATPLAVEATVLATAAWCDNVNSMFVNSQTGVSAAAIRAENTTTDIATQLTTLGYRHVYTATHATNANAGNALAKHFAVVNYSGDNTTITGEFKKSPGVAAEDLTSSEIAAMKQSTKKAVFYPIVDLQGSTDVGRWINTWTHSTYGEYIDDVVNLDAFINSVTVDMYNALANATTKRGQTPRGMAVLLASARKTCERYVKNNYLGARNYTNPDTGEDAYTVGYEILTKAEDILDLSDSDRNSRLSSPIKIRLFRAGAIHQAIVDLEVY